MEKALNIQQLRLISILAEGALSSRTTDDEAGYEWD